MVVYLQELLVLGNDLLRSSFANRISSSLGVALRKRRFVSTANDLFGYVCALMI